MSYTIELTEEINMSYTIELTDEECQEVYEYRCAYPDSKVFRENSWMKPVHNLLRHANAIADAGKPEWKPKAGELFQRKHCPSTIYVSLEGNKCMVVKNTVEVEDVNPIGRVTYFDLRYVAVEPYELK